MREGSKIISCNVDPYALLAERDQLIETSVWQATEISRLTAERDAALAASRYETDLCQQALVDLNKLTAERDAALAASRYETSLCQQALDSVRELTAERDALNKNRRTADANDPVKPGQCWPDSVMTQWDYWRKQIANGDRSSMPRDWFEGLAPEAAPEQEPVAFIISDPVSEARFFRSKIPKWIDQTWTVVPLYTK